MFPTFFIIGAAKSGTTSLNNYLSGHPEIHMASWKEPHFFAEPLGRPPTIKHRISSPEEYERLFDSHLAVRGEASPSYSFYPVRGGVPARIKEHVPHAKFIYLVRDPIDRIVSHYAHQMSWDGERRPLTEALGDLGDPHNSYICASRYATQVEQYLRVFPDDRMLVIDSAELRRARETSLKEVFDFLGVASNRYSAESADELNATAGHRVIPNAYSRLRHRGPLRRLPRPVRLRLQRLAEQVENAAFRPVEKPEVADALHTRLSEIFIPEVKRLRQLTGKPFRTWSL